MIAAVAAILCVSAGSSLPVANASSSATPTPTFCTKKGKILDGATTFDSLTTGTYYLKNCTGRRQNNVGILRIDIYPDGASCPPGSGVGLGDRTLEAHELFRASFPTGLNPACHGKYDHAFVVWRIGGKRLDTTDAVFVVP